MDLDTVRFFSDIRNLLGELLREVRELKETMNSETERDLDG